MDEPRILTDDETYQRRSQRASSVGPSIVTLCAAAGCPRAAANGSWCGEHRPRVPISSAPVVPHHLTRDDYDTLAAQVEADAAPLFVLAMSWIARQQLVEMGVTLDSLETSMHRIRGELEGTGP